MQGFSGLGFEFRFWALEFSVKNSWATFKAAKGDHVRRSGLEGAVGGFRGGCKSSGVRLRDTLRCRLDYNQLLQFPVGLCWMVASLSRCSIEGAVQVRERRFRGAELCLQSKTKPSRPLPPFRSGNSAHRSLWKHAYSLTPTAYNC